ncbi:MAG TPA: SOS response-associated peptidase, partial [Fluviicola sp.]|nr:SOS response-associated peptidase [Fluviicola sp.]
LNAKSETLHEKPAFKNVQHQRCLVIADAFYEWQWLDSKGKEKQKYELTMPPNELFAFAGIWSDWINPVTHEKRSTYAILTAEANELMQKIHNTKKRMPLIVAREHEDAWLKTGISKFDNDKLIANKTGEIFGNLFDSLF